MSDLEPPHPSSSWPPGTGAAIVAAIAVFAFGILLMGLPGAIVLEAAVSTGLARKPKPDSGWPLALLLTLILAVLVVPASLALRHKRPDIVGWAHAGWTALLTIAGTFLFSLVILR